MFVFLFCPLCSIVSAYLDRDMIKMTESQCLGVLTRASSKLSDSSVSTDLVHR